MNVGISKILGNCLRISRKFGSIEVNLVISQKVLTEMIMGKVNFLKFYAKLIKILSITSGNIEKISVLEFLQTFKEIFDKIHENCKQC